MEELPAAVDEASHFGLRVESHAHSPEGIKNAIHAADLLGHSNAFGSIKPGKYADIIAVAGDPITDIRLLGNVQFVMKDGKVYKQCSRWIAL